MAKWVWPEGRAFAFTVFDDPDGQWLRQSEIVYGFLRDAGFRTTVGVWAMEPPERNSGGETCESEAYRTWAQGAQRDGFEMGYHNGAPGDLSRDQVIRSLDLFREYFGRDPATMSNHYNREAIYWGPSRLSALQRLLYRIVTLDKTTGVHRGDVEGQPFFWGDVCRDRITYCRNFVFRDVNTLKKCPWMPYHDVLRPFVKRWYASCEGATGPSFVDAVSERAQDRLESEGGACIMYSHFGHGFVESNGQLNPRFRELMERLSRKNGWFVPVSTMLGYLESQRGPHVLTDRERHRLERRWLLRKLVHGTS